MLVATAGHIDHGKTTLVRALTGVETDRLPEEKSRGISIDLGFAYWRPEPGLTIGFVDVPGHEKFVRNMLAGVTRVDLALLVVAADDGVMPQTREHLAILDLLGAPRAAVAITKTDRVDEGRVAAVRDEVTALVARTALAGAPVFEVAATVGAGVEPLAAFLVEAARAEAPAPDTGRTFRLAIDRAFSVTGTGTVVTGTARDAALAPGARLILAPEGIEVRVRGLQSAGASVAAIEPSQRAAIALAGLDLDHVHRGDWLVVPGMDQPTRRLAARLRIIPDGEALRHNGSVHLHIGTAAIPARVLIPGGAAIGPGSSALVQLVLGEPTLAVTGDRFVIRDQAGRTTLGGGVVVDPVVSGGRRHVAQREQVWAALENADPAAALAALLAIPGHEVDVPMFERRFNLRADAVAALVRAAGAVIMGKTRAIDAARVEAARAEIVAAVKTYHRDHPEANGLPIAELDAHLATPLSPAARQALRREMVDRREIASGGSYARMPGHIPARGNADVALWHKVLAAADARGGKPFTTAEIAKEIDLPETETRGLFARMRGTGDIWRVGAERMLPRAEVARLADVAASLTERKGEAGFTAADMRDAAGIGRNLVIEVLEFFDRVGVTRRRGDARAVQANHGVILRRAAELERGLSDLAFAARTPARRRSRR
ncbi:selenocysteine-specific translation elongation factor [Amaricoccus solimangrovi]|uniref:Selenocysteine-specific translation elongation factor n=1 Tax=Amaricoccus solimangrovi TaxID=2589815 RepID=A0A501WG72_9RHOB|nr:selenocysteine-specific translation elongation factor [Amaricoccus solimangrovi]TPE47485.1 selenocysteine-specific translation elongation factor [Amaricoccus solimangrovi]